MDNHTTGIAVLQNSFMILRYTELQVIAYITPKVIECSDKLLQRSKSFVTGFFISMLMFSLPYVEKYLGLLFESDSVGLV